MNTTHVFGKALLAQRKFLCMYINGQEYYGNKEKRRSDVIHAKPLKGHKGYHGNNISATPKPNLVGC